jgi:hypothetical protein
VIRLALFLVALTCAAQDTVRFEDGVFRVAAAPGAVLQIFVGDGDVPPVSGTSSVENGTLTFRPRFPLAPGIHVRAVFRSASGAPVETRFEIPKAALLPSTTRVAHVYPSANLLPENQLKFYIYFSAPMEKGEAWSHIHLLKEDGQAVKLPFLEIDQELWDPAGTRLTVLFDPGRIKRGVLPLEAMGPAIEQGKSYTLVIDREWQDANGTPLVESFHKAFRVGPADRTPVDVTKWKIAPPRAGTTEPLTISFPEPLDYALLQHLLQVSGSGGVVDGVVTVDRDETEWRLTPRNSWRAGDHKIIVQTTLEDLAGNHVGRAFDVDVFDKVTPRLTRETVNLTFRVR